MMIQTCGSGIAMQEARTDGAAPKLPRILRVNVAGRPIEWLHWQEAVALYARGLVVWTLGDEVMKVRGGFSRLHRRRTVLPLHSIVACDGQIVPELRSAPPLTNRALFRRDANLCLYCGQGHLDRDLTRDHVLPRSRGGTDHWENVVAACKRCNHFKGNRLLSEIALELRALPYTPNFAEYLALINSGRILGDQMEFLKAQFGRDSRQARH
jgi:5-methylcytosine-specific restriction endonuclease McrA